MQEEAAVIAAEYPFVYPLFSISGTSICTRRTRDTTHKGRQQTVGCSKASCKSSSQHFAKIHQVFRYTAISHNGTGCHKERHCQHGETFRVSQQRRHHGKHSHTITHKSKIDKTCNQHGKCNRYSKEKQYKYDENRNQIRHYAFPPFSSFSC